MDDYEWKKTIYTVALLVVCLIGFVVTLIVID